MLLPASMATDGSRLFEVLFGTWLKRQVTPLSSEIETAATSASSSEFGHLPCGRYTAPSGPTLTWPFCAPAGSQSGGETVGTCGPNVRPPSSLREQKVVTGAWPQ